MDAVKKPQVWSYGGGTQSVAIAVLCLQGRVAWPEYIVMADTGRERTRTFRYLEEYVQPALTEAGHEVIVLNKDDYRSPDLYSRKGDTLLIPAFTDQAGRVGKLPTFCSKEWKARVVRRYLTEQAKLASYDLWLGYTIDEFERMAHNETKAVTNVYPLIDLRLTRADCISLVEAYGWPKPPKSACWMCPNRADFSWLEMKREDPEDFALAVAFEKEVQQRDPHIWLHSSGKPLDAANFNEDQLDMFSGCTAESCMT